MDQDLRLFDKFAKRRLDLADLRSANTRIICQPFAVFGTGPLQCWGFGCKNPSDSSEKLIFTSNIVDLAMRLILHTDVITDIYWLKSVA